MPVGTSKAHPYNLRVPFTFLSLSRLSIWVRFAAFLSFLAIFLALVAPASMLAQELRTGKLGGICSFTSASTSTSISLAAQTFADAFASLDNNKPDHNDARTHGASCELCGTLGLVLPILVVASNGPFVSNELVAFFLPPPVAPSDPGLPFSRGPPAL